MRSREPSTNRLPAALLLCTALLVAACGSSITIEIGAIRVDVVTIGNNLDPDGYVIRVTGNGEDQSQAVGVSGQVVFAVNSGRYRVELTEKATNCVTDLNPQLVDVGAGETVNLLFRNLCG